MWYSKHELNVIKKTLPIKVHLQTCLLTGFIVKHVLPSIDFMKNVGIVMWRIYNLVIYLDLIAIVQHKWVQCVLLLAALWDKKLWRYKDNVVLL